MRAAVIIFPGSNCDRDLLAALRLTGHEPIQIWHKETELPKNIDYIAISCSTYAATKRVLDAINFPLEKTGIECLTKVPHMGTNDLIFQLEHGLEKGLIEQGSKILMTGTSAGFSIATMALEW